jgi:hypothetical protein
VSVPSWARIQSRGTFSPNPCWVRPERSDGPFHPESLPYPKKPRPDKGEQSLPQSHGAMRDTVDSARVADGRIMRQPSRLSSTAERPGRQIIEATFQHPGALVTSKSRLHDLATFGP